MVVAQEVVVAVVVVQVAAEAAVEVGVAMVCRRETHLNIHHAQGRHSLSSEVCCGRMRMRRTKGPTTTSTRYSSTHAHTRGAKKIERVRMFAIMFEGATHK